EPSLVMPANGTHSPYANPPELLGNSQPQSIPSGRVDKEQALEITRHARMALARGDIAMAEKMARQAIGLAPETAYAAQEDRPALVLLEIQKAKLGGSPAPVAGASPYSHVPGA